MDYLLLANSEKFRKFYRLMCKMTGLTLVLTDTTSEHRIHLDYRRDMAELCCYMRNNPEFNKLCKQCDRCHSNQAVEQRKGFYYQCHAGLIDMAVPIFIANKHIATFMGGQILSEPPDEENFAEFYKKVKSFDFSKAELKKIYFDTAWMTPGRLDAAFELIEMFAEHFYELGPRLFESNIQEPALEKAKRYIYENFTGELTLEDVAQQVDFTPTYFCRWFRNKCGVGYLEYLQKIRIEKACRLLETTDFSIARIAVDSGFNSLTTFNRAFRKQVNCNPKDYRKKSKAD